MKRLLLLALATCTFFGADAQRKNKRNDAAATTTQQESEASSEIVTSTGIYEASISASTKPFEMSPGVFTIPVSLEDGFSSPEGEVTVGFVKGILEADYIVNPDSTNSIVAYVAIGERIDEENEAIRFISFDENFILNFQALALDENGNANEIQLYGIDMDTEVASDITGVNLVSNGESIKSYLLVGASLEKIDNPAIVLVAADLIRPKVKETVTDYAPETENEARMVKVTGIGYEEMAERTNIDSLILPYLNKKKFMKVRNIWSENQNVSSSSSSSSARILPSQSVNKNLLNISKQNTPATKPRNRKRGS